MRYAQEGNAGEGHTGDRPSPVRNGRYCAARLARSVSLGIRLPMKIRASSR